MGAFTARKLQTQVLRLDVGAKAVLVTRIARGKDAGFAMLDPATLDDITTSAAKPASSVARSTELATLGHVLCANAKLACIVVDGMAHLYSAKTRAPIASVPGGPFDQGLFTKRYVWLRGEFGNGLFAFSLRAAPTKFPDPLNLAATTVTAFAVDRSERWCAIGNSSGYVICVEAKTGEQRFGGRPAGGGHVTALAFNKEADVLYAGSASGMLVRIALA
ncbi:MAG TPA: hypothetical protein PLF40_00320 [Kofleriaceae bacterium]|nr:hypothetical protein [Kofleriaceae bacterium]